MRLALISPGLPSYALKLPSSYNSFPSSPLHIPHSPFPHLLRPCVIFPLPDSHLIFHPSPSRFKMGTNNRTKIPLVPLAKGSVLLPGVTLRIPVSNRPDLANLLSSLVDKPSRRDANTITFGCVPLSSPFLGRDGQQLLEGADSDSDRKSDYDVIDAGQARKEDLFRYGTIGKVIGVQRRAYSEPFLLVQGQQRFSIKKVLRDRPYFEAEVFLHDESSEYLRSNLKKGNVANHIACGQTPAKPTKRWRIYSNN